MVLFVYVLVFDLLMQCSASSPYTIELVSSWKDRNLMLRDGTPPSLIVGEPFTVQISSDRQIHTIRCSSESDFYKIYLNSGLKSSFDVDRAGIHNYTLQNNVIATAAMNGTWQCQAYLGEGVGALACLFDVKATNPSSSLEHIDLKQCHDNPCHELAICNKTVGGFKCSCPRGYKGNGVTCNDVNECAESTLNGHAVCSILAECQNNPGSFICTCPGGFTGDAYSKNGCVDVDECDNPEVCRAVTGSACENYQGGYNCSCPKDLYVDSHIGCVYRDACGSNPCASHALCQSRKGTFHCSCPEGFQGDAMTQCFQAVPVTEASTPKAIEIEAIPDDQPRTPKELEFGRATSPYIKIWIYKRRGRFHQNITSMLELQKTFTIYVTSPEKFSRIHCFKKEHPSETYVNEPLQHMEPNGNVYYNYRAPYQREAIYEMNAVWTCSLNRTPSYHLQLHSFRPNFISPEFPIPAVTKVPEPVTKKYTPKNTPAIKTTISTQEAQNPVSTTSSVYIKLIDDIQTPCKIDYNVSNIYLGKPFDINVEKYLDFTFYHIKCHYAKNEFTVYVDEPLIENRNVYTVTVMKATETMDAKWNCILNTSHGKRFFQFSYKSKTTGIASSVSVNDVNITITESDKEETGYDGSGVYWYREGELAKITCHKEKGMLSVLFDRYYTENKRRLTVRTQFTDAREQTVYVKLTTEYHNSSIDCIVKTKLIHPEYFNIVRLYFYELSSDSDNDLPTFYVNGSILAPAKMVDKTNYVYEYYKGEVLSIKGSMNSKNKQWVCLSNRDDFLLSSSLKEISTGMSESFDITVTQVLTYNSNCTSPIGAFHLELKPASPPYNFDPAISGLSFAQTQVKYLLDAHTYVIVYKNNGNKELTLRCFTVKPMACVWIKNEREVVGSSFNNQTSNYRFVHEHSFETNVIQCKCTNANDSKNYTALVEIINDIIEPEQKPVETSKDETQDMVSFQAPTSNTNTLDLTYIMVIIGVTLFAVILVVWLIVGIYKRKRKREQALASDINYESLDDGLMPPPRQWDNYSHPADIDDSYTYAVPHVANNTGNMTSGQKQPASETLYAEVGGQGEPNYASVELKGAREPKNEYANLKQQMPAYSQIKPKKLRDNKISAPQVLPKLNEDNYSQVVPKSLRNQPESSKYVNLQENQRYANAQANVEDYAEPAYCEVNIKK